MRLKTLVLERYGCFERAALNFAAEPGRINVMVAPNGAGKSVLRQAFHDLLFDIPLQSVMKFRFGYSGMSLQAEAVDDDGTEFGFGWVRHGKGQRVTTDPARYARLREAVTPRQLEQLFCLDTARLRQGGTDLQGGETLAGALLSGTGELARPRKLRTDIEARQAANWGQNKSKPPLNAAAAVLVEARKRARAAVERPQDREREERALATAKETRARVRADQHAAQTEINRLHRIALVRPHLAALSTADSWLEAHADTPALPAGLEDKLAAAREQMARAETRLTAAREEAAAAARAVEKIVVDEPAQLHAEALAVLPKRLGQAEETTGDIIAVRAERAAALELAATLLRGIDPALPIEQAGDLVPGVAVLAIARSAIRAHAALLAAQKTAADRARAALRRKQEAETPPAHSVQLPDGLAALLREIRAERNPAQHVAECAATVNKADAVLKTALAKVPGWSAGAAALCDLNPCADTAFERVHAALSAAEQLAQRHEATLGELDAAHGRVTQSLAALTEKFLPDDAAIAAGRARRDLGWRLIYQRAFAAEAPDLEGEAIFAGAEPLPLAFERSMRAADSLADQRIDELDRVRNAADLTRELTRLEAALVLAAAEADKSANAARGCAVAWADAVAPLGLKPDSTIAEVRQFLAARASVVAARESAELARQAEATLETTHAAWALRLGVLLNIEAPGPTLPDLLIEADAQVQTAETAQKILLVWQTNCTTARQLHLEAVECLADADAEIVAWNSEWTAILLELGRPPDESPEATAAVLDRIEALAGHLRDATTLGARIQGMQDRLDRFAGEAAELAKALDEPPADDALATARLLIARYKRAAEAQSTSRQAQATLAERKRILEHAQIDMDTAQVARNAVVAACGAIDLDDAAIRIAASREHTRHAAMRDAALAGVRDHGGGRSREALTAEAATANPDEMQAALAHAEALVEDAGARAEAAAIAESQLQSAFDAGAEATDAIQAAADHAAAAATYARLLDEQLVLIVAGMMLRDSMEVVEAEIGDGGVERLSSTFAGVTAGAYGVVVDEDDGTTLHAVEHRFPQERKALSELSEGTRDQLYLALRIAALRDHAAGAAALPFIADDILQTFDNARALATLEALAGLSHQVQVIVLTHHAHVADLAAGLGEAVHVQVLA
jgi:uncharacterized protein YhaN